MCQGASSWTPLGVFPGNRSCGLAVTLDNGAGLCASGTDPGGYTKTAFVFDPASNTWLDAGTGMVHNGGFGIAGVRLQNGKVLLAGGYNPTDGVHAYAELFEPDGGRGGFRVTGSMDGGRYAGAAALLPNGKVIVTGGFNSNFSGVVSSELYDPATETWTVVGSTPTIRYFNYTSGMITLAGGRALIAGEFSQPWPPDGGASAVTATALLYDADAGTWAYTGSMATPRYGYVLAPLPDGRALAIGGTGVGGFDTNTAETFNPTTGLWSPTGNIVAVSVGTISMMTGQTLNNGNVLFAGGRYGAPVAEAQVWGWDAGAFSRQASMAYARQLPFSFKTLNGNVVVYGGNASAVPSEMFNPCSVGN